MIEYKLDDPECIPFSVVQQLSRLASLVRAGTFIEELLEDSGFKQVACQLNDMILDGKIHAYHCTKQPHAGYFEEQGLRTLSIEQHHQEFDEMIATKATPSLRKRFQSIHADFRRDQQIPYREGLLWFCLSKCLIDEGGTWRFFKYFGGEAVYWPVIENDAECEEFLESLGEPVVVEVVVPAKDFVVFPDFAFSRALISQWATQFNQNFQVDMLEGHLKRDVHPQEIVGVHRAEVFCPRALEEIG